MQRSGAQRGGRRRAPDMRANRTCGIMPTKGAPGIIGTLGIIGGGIGGRIGKDEAPAHRIGEEVGHIGAAVGHIGGGGRPYWGGGQWGEVGAPIGNVRSEAVGRCDPVV
eukprot:7390650-Prymnesium_polylepis.1